MSSTYKNPVLASAEYIASKATLVKVDPIGVADTARKLIEVRKEGAFDLSNWLKDPLNPKEADEDALAWIFLVDTLNFSFWVEKGEECPIEWQGKAYTGYYSLCAAVNRAIDDGIDIASADFMASVTLEQLREIFKTTSGREIPLLETRLKVMNDAGKVLKNRFNGHFKNVVAKCNRNALKLMEVVVDNFESYRDEASYKGKNVKIYKRAQILVADIWAAFDGMSFGFFDDIDEITMFADYRVPQSLAYFKCLDYSPELLDMLNKNEMFQNGEEREVEIRGCSIWAVELIRREMERQMLFDTSAAPLNAIVIVLPSLFQRDFYLWTYAKQHSGDMSHIPIHKIRTYFY